MRQSLARAATASKALGHAYRAQRTMTRLANKTIFITGASSGIGKDTAIEYAETDSSVKLVLAARRFEQVKALASELETKYPGVKALPLRLDVSALEETNAAVAALPPEFAQIDILVNNAGYVVGVDKVGDLNLQNAASMFQTNVLGLMNVVLNKMKATGKGDIVNIGSIAGREPYTGGSIYCATKAAVRSFSESLRKELIATRIRVIEVDPGQVETEFSIVRLGSKEKADAVYKGAEPLIGKDIAEVIVFATSRRENVVIADTLVFPNHQAGATIMHKNQ